MNINQSTSISPVNNISTTPPPQQHEEQIKVNQSKAQEEGIDISKMGMASSFMSSLSAVEQAEVTDFTKSVQQAKQSGSFDATKLAQQAPESVNKLAEQLNVSTEDMLTKMSDKGPQGLMSGNIDKNDNSAIGAYLNVSTNNDQSDSIFDLFDIFSSDDKEKQSKH